ncbi:MAG: glycosyltransferase [Nanoarchaeota archaeon]|nr:glycosyltransferase [Nanoarchaeota archaeon]
MATVPASFIWVIYVISLYFVIFWFLVLMEQGITKEKKIKLKKIPYVSILIPVWNEEKIVAKTVNSAIKLDYPRDKYEIIVVNDGSTDRTKEIVEDLIKKNKKINIKLLNKVRVKGKGKAAPMNYGMKFVKGEYVVCFDADSSVAPPTLKQLLAHFTDKNVAAVLPCMKVRKPKTFMQKVQFAEYLLNMFYKKLMGQVDCVHVVPGAFSIYRTNVIKKLGGFDETNIVEDMEMTYRLQKYHYKVVQLLDVDAYTAVPKDLKGYYRQRNRWLKGTLLTTIQHKSMLFNKEYGDFGMFMLPMVLISGVLAVTMVLATGYYAFKPYVNFIYDSYFIGFDFWTLFSKIKIDLSLWDINFMSLISILIMLGLSLYIIKRSYAQTNEKILKQGFISLAFFLFIYFFLIGITWLGVGWDLLRGEKTRWR